MNRREYLGAAMSAAGAGTFYPGMFLY